MVLDHGQVRPHNVETLPAKARALLTILSPAAPEADGPAQPSIAELAGDLVGIGNGTHTDLSTNKAHIADLGR